MAARCWRALLLALTSFAVTAVTAVTAAPAEATLVYAWDNTVWAGGNDGSDPRPVAAAAVAPVISPGGRFVAAVRGETLTVFDLAGATEPRALAADAGPVQWSADGSILLARGLTAASQATYRAIDVATGEIHPLPAASTPSLTPDGERVVFSRQRSVRRPGRSRRFASDLYETRVRDGATRRLTRGGRSATPVATSAGILFLRGDESASQLWLRRPGGRLRRVRTPPFFGLFDPHLGVASVDGASADGRRVLISESLSVTFTRVLDTRTGRFIGGWEGRVQIARDGSALLGSLGGGLSAVSLDPPGPSRLLVRYAAGGSWDR